MFKIYHGACWRGLIKEYIKLKLKIHFLRRLKTGNKIEFRIRLMLTVPSRYYDKNLSRSNINFRVFTYGQNARVSICHLSYSYSLELRTYELNLDSKFFFENGKKVHSFLFLEMIVPFPKSNFTQKIVKNKYNYIIHKFGVCIA